MKVLRIIPLCAALVLSGCMTAQEREQQAQERAEQARAKLASQDDAACRSYGANPGSETYITCRTRLNAARLGAPVVNVSNDVEVAAPAMPAAPRAPVSCLRTGAMVTCN
jgi:hypothetical protein